MGKVEHLRELVNGRLDADDVTRRAKAGWKLIAVEWQRQIEGEEELLPSVLEEVPYGLQVAADCLHLEENPREREALVNIMELIVDDHPLSRVAQELNLRGFRTRKGSLWTNVSVFNLLPRLIEAGPRIFSTDQWEARRGRLLRAV